MSVGHTRSAIGAAAAGALIASLLAATAARADMQAGIDAANKRDFDTAFQAFIVEAEAGNPRAQALVANMYRQGWGVPRSMANAVAWYRRAADGGDPLAQYNLGVAYRDGLGVAQDDAAAVRWFEQAARQGQREAQFNLGVRYAAGQGTERDPVRAHAWFSRAAAKGDLTALRRRKSLERTMSKEQVREARLLAATLE